MLLEITSKDESHFLPVAMYPRNWLILRAMFGYAYPIISEQISAPLH